MKKLFFLLLRSILKKNIKFKNVSKNEECLIFGNGASLKNYNLKKFSNYDVIVTSMMYLHNDFKYLNVVADCEIAPFILYKFWKNPYSKKLEKNMKLEMLKKTNRFGHNHNYFLSLTNFFSKLRKRNFYYLYNYEKKNFFPEIDISNNFSYLSGSLFSMIGIAKYMGYKKIILIGTDYLLETPIIGHFYEKDNYTINKEVFKKDEIDFFKKIKNEIEIKIVVPENYSSKYFEAQSYKQFTNEHEVKKENFDIISYENLKLLDGLNMKYKIF